MSNIIWNFAKKHNVPYNELVEFVHTVQATTIDADRVGRDVPAVTHALYGGIVKAAINLLAACDENHDTKTGVHKYVVPYGAVNALRQALTASPQPQPVCPTCSGHGMIGGPSFYAPDEGGVPCPDCNQPQPVQAQPSEAEKFMDAAGLCRRCAAPVADAPIDMVLHCPACGMQHVDAPDEVPDQPILKSAPTTEHPHKMVQVGTYTAQGEWTNPPHRSHLCHGCGHIWRPADVPTNGVAATKTKGKADSPVAQPVQAHPKCTCTLYKTGRVYQRSSDPCEVHDNQQKD